MSSALPQTAEQTREMTRRMVFGYRRSWQLYLAVAVTLAVARNDIDRMRELRP